jgi:tetratricopeptide (TPR) repeat protein
MSSLITKAGKSRSQAAQKAQPKKVKKAAPKKPTRPAKAAAKKAQKPSKSSAPQKSKKPLAAKSAKKPPVSKKLAVKAKPAPAPRKPSKAASAKSVKKPGAKTVKAAKATPARKPAAVKTVPLPPPKKAPAPSASIAVKTLDQALKVFHRHDFAAAKAAFENLLEKFSDQLEIMSIARKYLAICDQRLASARSVPRNPDALYDQGVFEFNKGNVKEAVALFDKALKSAPQADHILYSLAAAHARLNDAARAMEALRRAVAIQTIHRSHARQDLDFTNLHDNEAFRQLTGFGFDLAEE